MPEPILAVSHIAKSFGDFRAVKDVSFTVNPGEVVGLLGVNGAGKTTVMSMLLGLITPDGGSIHVFGKDFAKHRLEILRRTNFCTTYAALPSNLKVKHNLRIFARLYGVPKPNQKVDELLELLEITRLADSITGRLSAGESTRVNLARRCSTIRTF
ncbi:ABC transporter ATP-binding protein [Luteolibacter sp. SL250]|uniref:ATP-binding cassette domain-containing protein n=1 Tax=Luteolibacter sp. SL250 TaxID=2995170 RepID=UPI00226E5011|nr:ABC transporter ATP-binding protein [Luteolibacter sp. SL250]WAC18370.1 ABC transporter ATP-binding protein [Luteolibacter sp. SL250]